MPLQNTIFNSELSFREYLINNSNNIKKIYLFEDKLDNIIYFYCFFLDRSVIAAYKKNLDNFDYYCTLYKNIANYNQLNISISKEQNKVLKITK